MKKNDLHTFEEYLDALYNILFDARMCFDLWWICINTTDRGKYLSEFSSQQKFFDVVGYSAVTSMVVSLYKIQETQGGTINLQALGKCLEGDVRYTADLKTVLGEKEKKAKKIWSKISTLRNRYYAHANNASTRTEVYRLAKITPNEFKRLTEQYLDILNMYASCIEFPKMVFNDHTIESTYTLLGKLKSLPK